MSLISSALCDKGSQGGSYSLSPSSGRLDELASLLGLKSYHELAALIYPKPQYAEFELQKKSGGIRKISAPTKPLKIVQRRLARILLSEHAPEVDCAHAFRRHRSIITNASAHVNKSVVIRFDLKDFFRSINFGRVSGFFQKKFGLEPQCANVLAQICCHNGNLPQGAPTSPVITNFICESMDVRLFALTQRHGCEYSRYADDLIFSFTHRAPSSLPNNLFEVKSTSGLYNVKPGPAIATIVTKAGFIFNDEKSRIFLRHQRQMVCGLVVNDRVTPPRAYAKQIRLALHIWRTRGVDVAWDVMQSRLHVRQSLHEPDSLVTVLRGKLDFLAGVLGRFANPYRRLAILFNELLDREGKFSSIPRLEISSRVIKTEDAYSAVWKLVAQEVKDSQKSFEGSAFRCEGERWVTSAHCIGSSFKDEAQIFEHITLHSPTKDLGPILVDVERVDWHQDIAVLKNKSTQAIQKNLEFFSFSDTEPSVGSQVSILGFPDPMPGQMPIWMKSRVVGLRTRSAVGLIQIDKNIRKGNSGGPMINEDLKIVGVVAECANVYDGTGADYAVLFKNVNSLPRLKDS